MRFGLKDETIRKIREVFACYPDVERVLLYGSRAKGNFKPGSDIDLTMFGKTLTMRHLRDIAEALDNRLLPYTIDLSIFAQLEHRELREHIERVGQLFYSKPGSE